MLATGRGIGSGEGSGSLVEVDQIRGGGEVGADRDESDENSFVTGGKVSDPVAFLGGVGGGFWVGVGFGVGLVAGEGTGLVWRGDGDCSGCKKEEKRQEHRVGVRLHFRPLRLPDRITISRSVRSLRIRCN